MPAIYELRLTDALVQAGPALEQIEGYGDDKFTLTPAADVGTGVTGVDGDTMHVTRRVNGWNITFTFMTVASGKTKLLQFHEALSVFPIKVSFGEFNLVGFLNLTNLGDTAASLGTTTTTITGFISKVSGNTATSPGRVLQVL